MVSRFSVCPFDGTGLAKPFIKDRSDYCKCRQGNRGKHVDDTYAEVLSDVAADGRCLLSFPDQAMRKKFPMEYQQRLLSEQRSEKDRRCLYRMCL